MIGTAAGWVMKLLAATLRMKVHDRCGIRDTDNPERVVYLLWHNRFFSVPPARLKLGNRARGLTILTSASHDGDMVAHAMGVFGFKHVRGSSSRRGVAALIGLKRALKGGNDICITPDGPRGPRYKMHPGALKLAESTGAPLVPIHAVFSSAWRLKTWDRFVIPKPFSRIEVTFGEPIHVDRGLDPAAFDAKLREVEAVMIDGTDDA